MKKKRRRTEEVEEAVVVEALLRGEMIRLLPSIDFTAGPVSLIGDPLGSSHGFTGCFYQLLGHDELKAEPLGICIP